MYESSEKFMQTVVFQKFEKEMYQTEQPYPMED